MTDTERLADIVRRTVKQATAPLGDHAQQIGTITARLALMEARAPVPGPKGDPGDRGEPGIVDPSVAEALTARLAGVEAQIAALPVPPPELSPEELSAAFTDLLRKELAIEPTRMQKRIIRNPQGQIDRVVEEPAE